MAGFSEKMMTSSFPVQANAAKVAGQPEEGSVPLSAWRVAPAINRRADIGFDAYRRIDGGFVIMPTVSILPLFPHCKSCVVFKPLPDIQR